MWRRTIAMICALLCAVGCTACSTGPRVIHCYGETPGSASAVGTETGSPPQGMEPAVTSGDDLSEEERTALAASKAIFDWIYPIDSGLNSDIKLVAIDTTALGLSDRAKEQFLLYAQEQSGYPVRDTTADELSEEGLLDRDGFRTGILISLSFEMEEDGTVAFSASKYRSPLGAIGTDEGRLVPSDGTWKLDEDNMGPTWIS